MSTLTNKIRAGGFIQSEAPFAQSRDRVTIYGGFTGAAALLAGTVLGKITASGKYTISPNTGSDGSQTALAVLFEDVDPTAGDVAAVAVIARGAEVRAEDLTYDSSVDDGSKKAAKATQLASVGILVRSMGGTQVSS